MNGDSKSQKQVKSAPKILIKKIHDLRVKMELYQRSRGSRIAQLKQSLAELKATLKMDPGWASTRASVEKDENHEDHTDHRKS